MTEATETRTRADGNAIGTYNRALAVANKAKRYATTTFVVEGEVRKTTGNGDEVAMAFAGFTPAEAVEEAEALLIAARVPVPAMGLTEFYAHLNAGMARMNAVNRVRGAIRRGKLDIADVVAIAIADTDVNEEGEEPAPMSLGAGIDALAA